MDGCFFGEEKMKRLSVARIADDADMASIFLFLITSNKNEIVKVTINTYHKTVHLFFL